MLLRLSLNPQSSFLSLPSTGITGIHHPTQFIIFYIFFPELGIEPRGILPPSYTPSLIFCSLFWNRVSLSCWGPNNWGWPRTWILWSQPPKYWDYKRAPPRPAYFLFWNRVFPGMVVHACNPSTWEAETRGSRFGASLSYLVRSSET